ncbi:hypothetical protein [Aquimarina aquimarini]|uniref:hypothetical protein n=1 Tax=Aquimarina aquimarini TaxID=1191734 RepID=UPI000D55D081|nr:hypothetical protein [Aquimarina aquimarini]
MKFKYILIILLISYFAEGFAQTRDTIYWHDATNKTDINGIHKIVHHLTDSTNKTVDYWKGNIVSIKYTGVLQGCSTSIETDTLFNKQGTEIKGIIANEVRWLGNSKDCDSLLLVKTLNIYNKGTLKNVFKYKQVGEFADCPCGTWSLYSNGKIQRKQEFGSCYDSTLENITLMRTEWSPDKKYQLELYQEQMPFAMPGQGSDHMATIILKNKRGEVLNYISSNSKENTMYRNIEIRWDLDNNTVWYGKARAFDLEKKK